MRQAISIVLVLLAVATAAVAQDARLKSLENGDEAGPWQAVGRLDIGGEGFCTGALISPQLVLTAAHCLFDKASGARINHEMVQFRAGWRRGRASAYRNVRRAVVHPLYVYDKHLSSERVRTDIALLELQRPIRNTTIEPFLTGARPVQGDHVGVVSYARDRSEAPSLQEVCSVLSLQEGVLVTSCTVDFGSSGAPIFSFSDGEARIVSVVSAKAEIEDQKVSLGAEVSGPLEYLRAELKAGGGVFQSPGPGASRIRVGETRRDTGAKFIRPGN